jgi:hypothetical protein
MNTHEVLLFFCGPLRYPAIIACLLLLSRIGLGQERNLNDIPTDITVPTAISAEPSAGVRVLATTDGWQNNSVFHTLYLPKNWNKIDKMPILVEFAGNGNYRNALGDTSTGNVEDTVLGYGLSGGNDCIWLSLPFIEVTSNGVKQNCKTWWGSVDETKRYCLATVKDVCQRYGGDTDRMILCGFSRGAIACNYIGLHDEEIAKLWRAFFCHSHYDGVIRWPYDGSDPSSAIARLQRLNQRPQWISHELHTQPIEIFLKQSGVNSAFTFTSIPYPNHTAGWLLRDLPERQKAREWLADVLRITKSAR